MSLSNFLVHSKFVFIPHNLTSSSEDTYISYTSACLSFARNVCSVGSWNLINTLLLRHANYFNICTTNTTTAAACRTLARLFPAENGICVRSKNRRPHWTKRNVLYNFKAIVSHRFLDNGDLRILQVGYLITHSEVLIAMKLIIS